MYWKLFVNGCDLFSMSQNVEYVQCTRVHNTNYIKGKKAHYCAMNVKDII